VRRRAGTGPFPQAACAEQAAFYGVGERIVASRSPDFLSLDEAFHGDDPGGRDD